MGQARDICSMTVEELISCMKRIQQPAFRARQIFSWIHQKNAESFAVMTDIPAKLRAEMEGMFDITRPALDRRLQSKDGTVKMLLSFEDGQAIETARMQYAYGLSVCVSTQAGCAMGCSFCASARGGKVRDLTAGEMLAQVYAAVCDAQERVHSVVLMGVGEPLDNFDSVMRFCDLLADAQGYGLSPRRVTLSTCGIVPKIYALADQNRQLTLAVSLHAATDERRSAIMPVNKAYPLKPLMEACRYYYSRTGRRITFEYATLHQENDTEKDADDLALLLKGMSAHVNLIPVNRVREAGFTATEEQTRTFAKLLAKRGVRATVRRTLGRDIEAACGQLRCRPKE